MARRLKDYPTNSFFCYLALIVLRRLFSVRLARSLFLLLFCATMMPRQALTQTPAASPTPSATGAAMPTQTSEYTLPPDKLQKAKALYDLRCKLVIIDTIYSLLVLLAILYFGVAARYRDRAERATKSRFIQALIFVPLLVLTMTALSLPLDAYQHSISLQYGLSVQHWGSWFSDVFKGEGIYLGLAILLAWGITSLIRKSPRRWWFYLWLITVPIIVFFIYLMPIVIDPLFNKFEPLEKSNPQLVDAIEKITTRAGVSIPRDRMFLMKASEKVTTLNAYVTGFGPSKRVVIWDTTIQKSSTPETLFVVGHEMGHYVLNHIVIGITATAVGLFFGFYILYLLSGWAFSRFNDRWHMRELSNWAAVPMLFLIFSLISIFSQPIGSAFSRQLEHNADVYGLEVTHGINANSQEAGAHAFQVLGELSLSYPYPSPLVVFWYADHPPIRDRVRFAHQYDPWSKGELPKYVK
jgi:STE24 endopeptidase